jgi:hypothetical protein
VCSSDLPNVVDWTTGTSFGGSVPVDQMNYLTNTIEMDLAAVGGDKASFIIKVNPISGYQTVLYDIVAMDGATIIEQWTNL